MKYKLLIPTDAQKYREIRLQSLVEKSHLYHTSYEEEKKYSIEDMEKRLKTRSKPYNFILGAFDNKSLIGIMGLHRYEKSHISHKAYIYGVYILPQYDTNIVYKQMLEETIKVAKTVDSILQISATETSEELCEIYVNLGFEIIGVERNSIKYKDIFTDEYHMVLYLDSTERGS